MAEDIAKNGAKEIEQGAKQKTKSAFGAIEMLGKFVAWLGKKDGIKDILRGVKKFFQFFWGKERTERVISVLSGEKFREARNAPKVEPEIQPFNVYFQLEKEGVNDREGFIPKEGDQQFKFTLNNEGKVELKSLNGAELTKEQSDEFLTDPAIRKAADYIEAQDIEGKEVSHLKMNENEEIVGEHKRDFMTEQEELDKGGPEGLGGQENNINVEETVGETEIIVEASAQEIPEGPELDMINMMREKSGLEAYQKEKNAPVENIESPIAAQEVGTQSQPYFQSTVSQGQPSLYETTFSNNADFGKLPEAKTNDIGFAMMNEKNGMSLGEQMLIAQAAKGPTLGRA